MKRFKNSPILNLIFSQKKKSCLILVVSVISTLLNSIGLTLLVPILFKAFNITGMASQGPSKIETIIERYLSWLPSGPTPLLLLVIFLFLSKNLLIALRVKLINDLSNKHLLHLREDLLRHYLKKDLYFFHTTGSGEILNQLTLNVERSSKVAVDTIETMGIAVQLAVYCLVLNFISWHLFTICFICSVPLLLGMRSIGNKIRTLSIERSKKQNLLAQALTDTLRGIRFVKLANREQHHLNWINELSQDLQTKLSRINFLSGIGQPITETAGVFILMCFVTSLLVFDVTQKISIDSFFTFLLLLSRTLPIFNFFIGRAIEISAGHGSLSEVTSAIKNTKWQTNYNTKTELKKIRNEISFSQVNFAYPETAHNALNEITLSIKKGESVAIVGPSGSGKSTITDLILRFYKVNSGSIKIDGVDINDLELNSYRKRIGLVPQDAVLFFSTIRANLSYFNPSANELDIWRALDQADMADFVSNLPNGLDTLIGENGVQLSGGQKQRISIARTLILNPEVMIFDEATSALDSISEAKIVDSIKKISQGRTTITIAHRLATILHCDKVFLIEHGWLIESGELSFLMKNSSRFKKFAENQSLKLIA